MPHGVLLLRDAAGTPSTNTFLEPVPHGVLLLQVSPGTPSPARRGMPSHLLAAAVPHTELLLRFRSRLVLLHLRYDLLLQNAI